MRDKDYEPSDRELAVFGSNWCGPARYEHGVETLVAMYEACGDGQAVEVYGTALPTRFYTIKALYGVNSVGEPKPAWELGTGSSQAKLAADIGIAVSTSMLGFHSPKG